MHNIDGEMEGYMIWCRLHQYAFDVAIPARGILQGGYLLVPTYWNSELQHRIFRGCIMLKRIDCYQ